jgi:NAD(P)-dependent dehydrogenase (short-subunit alcohol dehydrogenase family)
MVGCSRFQDKTAIVTGAGSGIGRAVVIRLVAEGAFVLGIDVNEVGLKETLQLTVHPERVSIAVLCVTDEQQVIEKVNDYVTRQGHLDVLVNVAGILRATHTAETTLEQFRLVIDTNLIGTFLMCRVCLPHLLACKGNIVNTASTAALYGHPYMAAYAASKGAVVALTKSLAREYILQGVRVNAVAPGGIATPMATSFQFPEGIHPILLGNLQRPDRQLGQPENIAAVVAMLASQDGSFINGEVIRIDGGVHS